MQYSHMLLALPVVASALILDKRAPAMQAGATVTVQAPDVVIETAVATVTVIVGPDGKPIVDAKDYGPGNGAPFQYGGPQGGPPGGPPGGFPGGQPPWAGHGQNHDNHNWGVYNHDGYHGHHAHPPAAPSYVPQQPKPQPEQPKPQPQQPKPQPQQPKPQPQQPKPQPQQPKPVAGGSAGGCPPDTSGAHMSPGVNGHPARSMVDSTNEIRRLYNPNAACLGWSDSLAQASQQCTNISSESALRANSGVVSDPGYDASGNNANPLAKTTFENSMYLMLCQAPNDPQMQGKCPFKTGEVGCSSGACQGHRDMIVDQKGEFRFMGAACNEGTKWMSCSFSKTNNIFD